MSRTSLISGGRFTKQLPAALAVAAALVVPAGALGIGAAASAATPKLSTKLLTIAQMPTGWSVVSLKSGKVGCLGDLLQPKGVTLTSTASTNFSSKAGVPVVEEKLATYANTKTGYSKIVANLAACKHFSGSLNGQKITGGTVRNISFSHYGNASEAFAVSYTIQATTVHEDLLIIRDANVVMGISEGNFGPVNTSQLQGFVNKAVADLA
jgi:hypothetical protein